MEHRDQALDHQWQLKIRRAEYEGQLAQRRLEQVDPANRLVAATLEQRWEQALRELADLRQQFCRWQKLHPARKHWVSYPFPRSVRKFESLIHHAASR